MHGRAQSKSTSAIFYGKTTVDKQTEVSVCHTIRNGIYKMKVNPQKEVYMLTAQYIIVFT